MKACALAAALDGRVIGAADAEISRAVHPGEASCDGDVAIAVSPDTIRILGQSQAKIALVPEGAQFPHRLCRGVGRNRCSGISSGARLSLQAARSMH